MCLGIEIHPGWNPFNYLQVPSRLPTAQDNPFFPVRAEVSKPFAALTRCPFRLSLSKPRPDRDRAFDRLSPTLRYLRASGTGASIPQPERERGDCSRGSLEATCG